MWSRRELLQKSLLTGAAALTGVSWSGCGSEKDARAQAAPKPLDSNRESSVASQTLGGYVLKPLGYGYDALEPVIDAKTMEIHHSRHHAAYINALNQALIREPEVASTDLPQLLANLDAVPASIRETVRNNGGGHLNHDLFWRILTPGGTVPSGPLAAAIEQHFGSLDQVKGELKKAALSVFGSGWAWLSVDSSGALRVETTPNQDTPIMEGRVPVLGLDVWEHAYYLQYQNRRSDYLDGILTLINWSEVAAEWAKATLRR